MTGVAPYRRSTQSCGPGFCAVFRSEGVSARALGWSTLRAFQPVSPDKTLLSLAFGPTQVCLSANCAGFGCGSYSAFLRGRRSIPPACNPGCTDYLFAAMFHGQRGTLDRHEGLGPLFGQYTERISVYHGHGCNLSLPPVALTLLPQRRIVSGLGVPL